MNIALSTQKILNTNGIIMKQTFFFVKSKIFLKLKFKSANEKCCTGRTKRYMYLHKLPAKSAALEISRSSGACLLKAFGDRCCVGVGVPMMLASGGSGVLCDEDG